MEVPGKRFIHVTCMYQFHCLNFENVPFYKTKILFVMLFVVCFFGIFECFFFSLQTVKSSVLKNTQGKTLSKVMHQSSYDDCMSCDC